MGGGVFARARHTLRQSERDAKFLLKAFNFPRSGRSKGFY